MFCNVIVVVVLDLASLAGCLSFVSRPGSGMVELIDLWKVSDR